MTVIVMQKLLSLTGCWIGIIALLPLAHLHADEAQKSIHVLVWDEQQPAQKQAYGDNFLGGTIAAHLQKLPGISVESVSIHSPQQGLDQATLDKAQVIIWWGHVQHDKVTPENTEAVVKRVLDGKLSLIALHSAHFANPFMRLMQERAKADALAQIPEAERATAKIDFSAPLVRAQLKPNAPMTPLLEKVDGVWKLTPPGCIFPAWRADGAPSHVTTLLPKHPIAKGLPEKWDIPQTEMYADPFHVPKADATLFEEKWDKGESFRSGLLWKVGKGQVFYFRPGHETFPIYRQAEPLLVLENAVRYLAN